MSKIMKETLIKDFKGRGFIDNEMRRERVQVVVRCRPLHPREISDGRVSCVTVDTQRSTIQVRMESTNLLPLTCNKFVIGFTSGNLKKQRLLHLSTEQSPLSVSVRGSRVGKEFLDHAPATRWKRFMRNSHSYLISRR